MRARLLIAGPVAIVASLLFAAGAAANPITVNTLNDSGGGCTLRDAIQAANMDSGFGGCTGGGGDDAITIAPSGEIDLQSQLPTISTNMTITGAGAANLTVFRQTGGNYGIFWVNSPSATVTISGMTITNGLILGGSGAGVANNGTLTLQGVTVSNNALSVSDTGSTVATGGGIFSGPGTVLTINNSTVTGNGASAQTSGAGFANANGGAILSQGTLHIDQSTISNNQTLADGRDTAFVRGAINSEGATTITRSTISGNLTNATVNSGSALAFGGGIDFETSAGGPFVLTLDRDTIANNTLSTSGSSGTARGGGVAVVSNQPTTGTASGSVTGSTIAGNSVSGSGSGAPSLGPNVWLDSAAQVVSFRSTIIANGIGVTTCARNGGNFQSLGYNLDTGGLGISSSNGACLQGGTTGDQANTGTPGVPNPALGSLQDNGGPTQTMAPGIGSDAVDKGTSVGTGASTDQRGTGFARTFDMNPASGPPPDGDGTDVGAFEQQIIRSPSSMSFGSQTWGTTSPTQTASVVNRTGNSLTPGTLAFGGTDPGEFQLSSDGCSNTALANNLTCTANVAFAPGLQSNGARSATLSIPTNVSPTLSVNPLTGTTTGYTPAAIDVAPAPKDFGSTPVGTPTASTQFTVTNTGLDTSGALSVGLTGSNASEFGITQDNCTGQTLVGGGTCTVLVRFAPTSAGGKTASLDITGTPGGTTSSALSGTATSPSGGGGGTGSGGGGGTEPTATLAGSTGKLKGSSVGVPISCPAGGPLCTGTVSLAGSTTLALISKKRKKSSTLGSASFSIPAGQIQTIRVAISKRARRMVRKKGKLRAQVTITTERPSGPKTSTGTLKIKR